MKQSKRNEARKAAILARSQSSRPSTSKYALKVAAQIAAANKADKRKPHGG